MKFAAAVILYNPNCEEISKINEYLDSFDIVYLYDNSLNNSTYYNRIMTNNCRLVYDFNGNNDGLPFAYNRILEYMTDKDINYLCTLDQDSIYTGEQINKMKAFIEKSSLKDIAIYAPAIQYKYFTDEKSVEYVYKKWVITSGSFIDLKVLRDENIKYDENYFIDKFEIDLCKQLTNMNYEIVMYHGSVLKQELGEDSGHKHPNHSAIRHYYLFRNRFYFNRKYYSIPRRWFLNIFQTLRHCLLIILYEKDKGKKIQSFFVAFVDYNMGKMGVKK